MSAKWTGGPDRDGDTWEVEIEHDRFDTEEPFVVSLWIEGESEGTHFDSLATPTPEQAREMAAALLAYADMAERANTADEARRAHPVGP